MPEIISLLSSPPACLAKPAPSLRSPLSPRALPNSHLGSYDFDKTGDLDFPIENAFKKRKISHAASRPTKDVDVTIDLSSDIELPTWTSPNRQDRIRANDLSLRIEEVDDIVISSSAPAQITAKGKQNMKPGDTFDLCSDSLPSDPLEALLSASQPMGGAQIKSVFSVKTANLLAGLSSDPSLKPKSKPYRGSGDDPSTASIRISGTRNPVLDDIVVSSPPKVTVHKAKSKSADAGTRQNNAAAKKAQKASDKEAEKARKQAEKAEKIRNKQMAIDLAEVNKSKTNKKDAIGEMQLEVSGDIQDTNVGNQLEEYLNLAEVTMSYVDEEVNLQGTSVRHQDLGSKIRWKRMVKGVYDEEKDEWFKAVPRITSEQHVLVYLKANDFAMIASGYSGEEKRTLPSEANMKENFDLHVATLRSRYKDCIPVYLIEGMSSWLKRNHNARNREYTAAVRAQQAAEEITGIAASSQAKVRKRKKPPVDLSFITADTAEDLLLHLQVAHQPIFIHHTTSATTSAEQIFTFTQHLATRPYRQIELSHNIKTASFCMTTGQVKTGDDARDTYIKMLQEVQRVTHSMAYGIENKYPSVRQLVEGFREEGNLMLEDVRKSANKDGAWTDRRLGPMVSKRLYRVFMGTDPGAMDGMS